jgi:hypothetical protein
VSPVPVPDGSQTIGDVAVSIIRTVVPGAIATALAWLLSRGFDLTAYGNAVNIYLVPAVLAAYYSLVRAGEARFPWLGVLLGYKRQPVYIDPAGTPVAAPAEPLV